jgi:ribosome-binding factor A
MGQAGFSRQDRVKKALMREVSDAIANDIKNPALDHQIISITDIDLAKDFSFAKVYLSFLSTQDPAPLLTIIQEAAPKIQSLVGRRMKLRNTTKLQFFNDDSLERGSRVTSLLEKIASEREDTGS